MLNSNPPSFFRPSAPGAQVLPRGGLQSAPQNLAMGGAKPIAPGVSALGPNQMANNTKIMLMLRALLAKGGR